MTTSFAKMATEHFTTKRRPSPAGGKIGVPTTYLAEFHGLPLMPVTPELVLQYSLKSPRESYMTFVEGTVDILEGDVLVKSTTEYVVRAVGPWPTDRAYLQVIVEAVKGS